MGSLADTLKWILEPIQQEGILAGSKPFMQDVGSLLSDVGGTFADIGKGVGKGATGLYGLLQSGQEAQNRVAKTVLYGRSADLAPNYVTAVQPFGSASRLRTKGIQLLGHNLGAITPPGSQIDSSGASAPSFDAVSRNLQDNLKRLLEAKSAAIRRSGSGAGAQYNDAINLVEQQIAQMEEAKRQSDQLYKSVAGQTGNLFDQAIAGANFGPEAAAAQQRVAAKAMQQRSQDFDKIYSDTDALLSRIGVDAGTSAAVTAKIGEIEGQIMDSAELKSGYRERIASLSGTLADAAARYAKASSLADLGRKRAELQLGLDKQLQDLADRKDQLVKARSRAIASARRATAKQYRRMIPKSADEYAQWHMLELFREAAVDPGQQGLLAGIAREAANAYSLNLPDGTSERYDDGAKNYVELKKLILDHKVNDGLPWTSGQIQKYTPIVWQAVQIYREGISKYNDEIAGSDPTYFAPNTVDRAAANYAHSLIPGVDERDIEDYALSPEANSVYVPHRSETPLREKF